MHLVIKQTFENSTPLRNNKKTLFNENNCSVCLIRPKLIFFETLIIFLEPTLKLITGMFDLQK